MTMTGKGDFYAYEHTLDYDFENVIYVRVDIGGNVCGQTKDIALSTINRKTAIVLDTALYKPDSANVIFSTYEFGKGNYGQRFTYSLYLVENWDWGSNYQLTINSNGSSKNYTGTKLSKRMKCGANGCNDSHDVYEFKIDAYSYSPYSSGAYFVIKATDGQMKSTVKVEFNWYEGKIHDCNGWRFQYNNKDEVTVIEGFDYKSF